MLLISGLSLTPWYFLNYMKTIKIILPHPHFLQIEENLQSYIVSICESWKHIFLTHNGTQEYKIANEMHKYESSLTIYAFATFCLQSMKNHL